NGALLILAVKKLIPKDWASSPQFYELFGEDPPEAQLNEAQVKALRTELGKATAALTEAGKLKDFPRGRFPITYPRVGIPIPSSEQDARQVTNLLEHDVLLRAQDGKADLALDSCRAILNCGRAIGDEPL